jgi:hypothetical protein
MKTIKHKENGTIRRVENKEADLFTSGSNPVWVYTSKSEWKLNRKTNTTTEVSSEVSSEKTTKAGKRKNKAE